MRRGRMLANAVALLALFGAAACGSSEPNGGVAADASGGCEGASSDGPIKVGAVFNLTGPGAVLGADEVRGAEAYVEHRNQNGGVLDRDLELIVIDAASDPQKAADAVSRLAEREEVSVIVGPDGTPTTLAAIPAATRARTPLISTGGSWPYGLESDELEWIFTATPPTSLGLAAYEEYWTGAGVESVAVIGADTPFLEVPRGFFAAGDRAVDLTTLQSFAPGATDITAQVTAARDSNPDFILSWSTGPDGVTTLRGLDSVGVDIPRGLNGGTTTASFEEAAKEYLEGVTAFTYRTQVLDSLEPGAARDAAQEYMDAMEAAGEDTFGGASNAVMAWDAMVSAVDAIEDAGCAQPEQVRDALEEQTFEGAIARWERSPDDHAGAESGYVIVRYKDGEWGPATP